MANTITEVVVIPSLYIPYISLFSYFLDLFLAKNLLFPLIVGLGICWNECGCLGFVKNEFLGVYFRSVSLGSLIWFEGLDV